MNPILQKDMEDIFSRNNSWERLENSTVLLTGAYGMLASYIVHFLLYVRTVRNINVKLIAVVRNKDKFVQRFMHTEGFDSIEIIQNDLSEPIEIEEDIDYIIHAASLASPQYYSVCPVDVLKPNTIGNYHLLELAKTKKVKGYLLFSSCDVYGTPRVDGLINENAFGHMDTLDIHNCYSESKRMAETMCRAFWVQHQVPVRIARIAHTYAPTMDIQNDPRVFASFVKNIVAGEDIVLKSDGSGKRTFCYITDAVAGYFKILFDGAEGEAYNVCNTSQFVSIRELAECLTEIYPEKNLHVICKQRSESENYTENKAVVGHERIPDNRKLQELGWEARVDLREGFKRVIQYIENEKQ